VGKTYEALVCGHMPSDFPEGPVEIDLPLQRDHRFPPFMRVATPDSELDVVQAVQDLQHAGYKKLMRKKPKPSQTLLTILGREYMTFGAATINNSKKHPVTRVALTPLTGRTHQLRVHCAALGHPIVADPAYGIYGEASPSGGLELNDTCTGASLELQKEINASVDESSQCMCLHAKELNIIHPLTGNEMKFEAPVPF
jgi:23S rRNA-/tRNA-specific pseudouridylate synthase